MIYIPLNTKDLAIELTMLAYGNRKNTMKFARANNSDLLRALIGTFNGNQALKTCTEQRELVRVTVE